MSEFRACPDPSSRDTLACAPEGDAQSPPNYKPSNLNALKAAAPADGVGLPLGRGAPYGEMLPGKPIIGSRMQSAPSSQITESAFGLDEIRR